MLGETRSRTVNGIPVEVPKTIGAYYSALGQEDSPYQSVDLSVIGGVSYFLNQGLYIGLRANFGFSDITKNEQDYSRFSLGDSQNFLQLEDKDRNFILQASVGFSL